MEGGEWGVGSGGWRVGVDSEGGMGRWRMEGGKWRMG